MQNAIDIGLFILKVLALSTAIVFILFILESAIHAKISELKQRKMEKKCMEDAIDKLVDKIVDNAFIEVEKENDKHE